VPAKKPIVAVADAPFPDFTSAEQVLAGFDATVRKAPEPTPEAILEAAAGADAVMVTYAKLPREVIERLDRCRIIARMGIGLDNIDVDAATEAGIVVANVPDYCVDEVSDHALALLLTLARAIPRANQLVRNGGWAVGELGTLHRLQGRVLGLTGFGRIGRTIAHKAQAFGLQVIAFDPYLPAEVAAEAGVELVDFDTLLARSDFISVHTPLTPETRHLFGAVTFDRMKPGAILINTSRGGLVDEEALAEALDTGKLGGAALDVLGSEPPAPNSALLRREDVILTPHMAYYSEESTAELQRKAAEEVVRVLQGNPPRCPVNPSVFNAPRRAKGGSSTHDYATVED